MSTNKAGRGSSSRPTRTERTTARSQPRRPQKRSGFGPASWIGLSLALVAIAAIAMYAYSQSTSKPTSTAHNQPALADRNALNPAPHLLAVGSKAPNFTLHDTAGQSFTLSAQRGHPVLLEFFAVWCPVCHAEAPTISRLTRTYAPKGVTVWSVLANPYGQNYESSGGSDLSPATESDLQWFAHTYNVQHPQLVDPRFQVVNEYGINAYPGLYVIDSRGMVTYAQTGARQYSEVSAALTKALAGR